MERKRDGALRPMFLMVLACWLAILFCWVAAGEARADAPGTDPTTVLVLRPDAPASVLTKIPVLFGTQYLLCVTTSEEWPRLTCLKPNRVSGKAGQPQEWDGEWVPALAVIGREG